MVTEGDCSCTDTTEPSNVTSMRSDDVTSARNSDANLYAETNDKAKGPDEGSKGTRFLNMLQLYRPFDNRRISLSLRT